MIDKKGANKKMNSEQYDLITNLINQVYQSPNNSTSLLMNYFQLYSKKLSGISIFKFDERNSNVTSFDELNYGNYNLCRLGDYNKSWKIDTEPNLVKNLRVKKEAYLDQNIMINLYQYSLGK